MTINQMRCFILDSYPNASKGWRNEVAFVMSPNRIVAIYKSIINREQRKLNKQAEKTEIYHQMDIFEWLAQEDAKSDVKGSHTNIAV